MKKFSLLFLVIIIISCNKEDSSTLSDEDFCLKEILFQSGKKTLLFYEDSKLVKAINTINSDTLQLSYENDILIKITRSYSTGVNHSIYKKFISDFFYENSLLNRCYIYDQDFPNEILEGKYFYNSDNLIDSISFFEGQGNLVIGNFAKSFKYNNNGDISSSKLYTSPNDNPSEGSWTYSNLKNPIFNLECSISEIMYAFSGSRFNLYPSPTTSSSQYLIEGTTTSLNNFSFSYDFNSNNLLERTWRSTNNGDMFWQKEYFYEVQN